MNVIDAAKYIVHLSYNMKQASLTPLKLQKILYYAQGWSYVWDDIPLFDDEFEAWQYGPVNKMVYDCFREYRSDEIPEKEGIIPINATSDEIETLEVVWKKYCNKSAFELVDMTHQDGPWWEAYNRNLNILNSDIKVYFQSKFS